MIEKVKKITHKNCYRIDKKCPVPDNPACKECEDDCQQICQLFEKEVNMSQVVGRGGEVDNSDLTPEEPVRQARKLLAVEGKNIPRFKSEDEERAFWATHDSVNYLEGAEQVNLEPDEGGLLTKAVIEDIYQRNFGSGGYDDVEFANIVCKYQQDLTARDKDAEIAKLKEKHETEKLMVEDYVSMAKDAEFALRIAELVTPEEAREALAQKDAECQARVERIRKAIEKRFTHGSYQSGTYHFYTILCEKWQNFWKQEGVK